MDLSKASDTINYSLLLAKLKEDGIFDQALSLLQSYRCNRFQRSIINGSFSNWNEVITEVLHGFILGPLLFNIFLNYIISRNVSSVNIPIMTLSMDPEKM